MNNKVIKMINSYTRKKESERARTQGEHRVSKKRTMVFGGIMVAIIGVLLVVAMNQKNENHALGEELAQNESVLEEREDERADLEQKITQLNDDDYIMRIARSEFFLSEEDEIIFNFSDHEEDDTVGNSSESEDSEK